MLRRESRGFTSRRVVNESTLICLPVLTYFFSIIHPGFIRSEESRKKQHGWKMTQHRIEDTAFSFAPVESRRAGQTNLSWRFFQPIQTSAEATSYLYLAWSRVNSIHPHKAREDWLPFLLDCAGTLVNPGLGRGWIRNPEKSTETELVSSQFRPNRGAELNLLLSCHVPRGENVKR